jgi:hypothetical protein
MSALAGLLTDFRIFTAVFGLLPILRIGGGNSGAVSSQILDLRLEEGCTGIKESQEFQASQVVDC